MLLHGAATVDLKSLVRAYRADPTPAGRAVVESYAASHPNEDALAHLALGVVSYEQKDYDTAIAALQSLPAKLPQIADYAAFYLAAARVEFFGVSALARGLNDMFAVLTLGRRIALPRQQTLRATLDWGHNLLSPTEQAVLRCISIFRTTFTLVATPSMSRLADAIPSGGGSPSNVAVSSRSVSSIPNAISAARPAVTALRPISLIAVATRI